MSSIRPDSHAWMPVHFQKLSKVSLEFVGSKCVTPMNWGMSVTGWPEPHVKHLSSAASKYRLAMLCTGLKGPEGEAEHEISVGPSYFDQYSAQAIITLSYVAFETYLRMLGLSRQDYMLARAGTDYKPIAGLLRDELEGGSFSKLVKAMENKKLKERMIAFECGDDSELLAVCSALRNSFSHGKMGISHSVGLECAVKVKAYLLELIKADAELIIGSIKKQDASLLP